MASPRDRRSLSFQIQLAADHSEKATTATLMFKNGYHTFAKYFVVMGTPTRPTVRFHFLRWNNVAIDKKQFSKISKHDNENQKRQQPENVRTAINCPLRNPYKLSN